MNEESFITGNAKVVRSINRAMILSIIRTKQPIPRAEIAKITGLNKSTVSSIVTDLIQENLIYEQVKSDQNVGRNPVNLFLRKRRYISGAISIDVETTGLALVDIDGSIIGSTVFRTDLLRPEYFIRNCINEIRNLCVENRIEQLEGIGITLGGIVDSQNTIISYAPGRLWENFNVSDVVKKEWPELKILSIGNDAKSSALAELWFGNSTLNLSSFVFVSIGSGISSGIVIDGRLLDGSSQASGEFGHIPIIEGGETCRCGNNGCWEMYASDIATEKRFEERLSKERVFGHNGIVTLRKIISSARSGDTLAKDILKETGYYIGLGVANIVRSIDPEAVILSGIITGAWDIIYPEIIRVVKKRTFSGRGRNIQILVSSLSGQSRLLGAATLVIKEIFDYYRITAE